jgi:hypothetical protein
MKVSSATSLSEGEISPPYSEYQLVYSGNFPNNFGSSGWAEVTLFDPYPLIMHGKSAYSCCKRF